MSEETGEFVLTEEVEDYVPDLEISELPEPVTFDDWWPVVEDQTVWTIIPMDNDVGIGEVFYPYPDGEPLKTVNAALLDDIRTADDALIHHFVGA